MFGIGRGISFYICKDFLLTTMQNIKPEVTVDSEKQIQLTMRKRKRVIKINMRLISGKIQIDVDDTDYLLHIKTKTFKREEDVQLHILNIHKQICDAMR